MENNKGLIYAFAAYFWWGIIPLFWREIDHIASFEIVVHRMLWSCVLVTLLIVISREWTSFKLIFSQAKLLLRLFVASSLISANWAIFIWAVNSERLVETSLGYFINPLISVALGVVLFGEALRRRQVFALFVAALGVAYLFIVHGTFPWVSFVLAITFALYGAVKKTISLPATHGMAIETMCFFIPALAYLVYIESQGEGQFFELSSNPILLVLGGLFTLIPLLLFANAAKRISMTALGMMQYIGPTLQLIIGVLIYNEAFGRDQLIAFSFIWLALAIYSIDQILFRRKRKMSTIK